MEQIGSERTGLATVAISRHISEQPRGGVEVPVFSKQRIEMLTKYMGCADHKCGTWCR